MEFSLGQLLDVGTTGQVNLYRFQNFSIGQNVGAYSFVPFAFGGAVASLQGDNLNATLQFGNTQITRNFVTEAIENNYVAKVSTVIWDSNTFEVERTLYEYFGSCSSGGWNESAIQVQLNSILDAVQASIPGRRLRRKDVGNLPFTSQVRV